MGASLATDRGEVWGREELEGDELGGRSGGGGVGVGMGGIKLLSPSPTRSELSSIFIF